MARKDSRRKTDSSAEEWNKLRRRAGYSDDNNSISSADQDEENAEKWQRISKHQSRLHAPVKDHLYNLIDAPGRDDNKQELFGMAKSFPEVTRSGYRRYLHDHLSKKADEKKEDHPPEEEEEEEEEEETDNGHDKRRGAFKLRDFGPFYRFRIRYHAELAEFLGIFVLLAIGFASTCQLIVGGGKANYTTTVFAWGFAQMSGIYVAGGYSGAHLNPVITMNLWFFRGFPFRRMFSFWIAQFLGALAASAWIFILYYPALKKMDPEGWSFNTSAAFITAPAPDIPVASAWFNEVTCTALIHLIVFAVGDSHNISPARGMNALVIGFAVTALGSSFGYLSPFGMNPVRDFAPRIFLSMVGYPKQIWTTKDWWWITGEFTGPILGGFLGAFAYDLFIFDGPESPINFPTSVKRRAVKFWVDDVLHPLESKRHKDAPGHSLQDTGYDENPYRGTVHLQGQPAQ